MDKAVIIATVDELEKLGFASIKPQQIIRILKHGNFFSKVLVKDKTIMMLNSIFSVIKDNTIELSHKPSFFEAHPEFC